MPTFDRLSEVQARAGSSAPVLITPLIRSLGIWIRDRRPSAIRQAVRSVRLPSAPQAPREQLIEERRHTIGPRVHFDGGVCYRLLRRSGADPALGKHSPMNEASLPVSSRGAIGQGTGPMAKICIRTLYSGR